MTFRSLFHISISTIRLMTGHGMTVILKIWICTTQPRNFGAMSSRQLQSDLKDSITSIFSPFSIDFWSTIANPDHTINPTYDSGDGVHLNDAGHAILVQRVIDADLLSNINYLPPQHVDYGITTSLLDMSSECGDSTTRDMNCPGKRAPEFTKLQFILSHQI